MKYLMAAVLIFVALKVAFFGIDFLADIIGGGNTFLVLLACGVAFGLYFINVIDTPAKPTKPTATKERA